MNTATLPTGELKQVILHNGDFNEEVLPGAHLRSGAVCRDPLRRGAAYAAVSDSRGALRLPGALRRVVGVAQFPRPLRSCAGLAVRVGCRRPRLLAGRSGEELGNTSIKYVEIQGGELEESRDAERLFVMSLQIEVRGSIHNADAPAELVKPTQVDVQRQQVEAPAPGGFDASNSVTAGLDVPLGLGFAAQVASGAAVIDGARVAVPATVHTFAPSSDTYRDLTLTGTWVFISVPNGADAAAPAPGHLRVGCTATDAAGIVADTFLCSVQVRYPAANSPDVVTL